MIDISDNMLLPPTGRDGSGDPRRKPYSYDLDGSIGYALAQPIYRYLLFVISISIEMDSQRGNGSFSNGGPNHTKNCGR
jgi:hypothetical protein